MKNMILSALAVLVCLLPGCAPKLSWTSDPLRQNQENEAYEIVLEPLKQGHDFFVAFKIMVKNKTGTELKIDWNKTQYIHNGKSSGVFVFKGIDPAMLKNKAVPADVIGPKGTLTKEIAPARRVAWAPLSEKQSTDKSRISPGILPPGRNGVLLIAVREGQEIPQQITVEIIEEKLNER